MLQRRGWRLDVAAFGLLCGGLLVALSLFSYDPADPPGTHVYPLASTPANLLGFPGAWLAHHLRETFGLAVYVLLAAWFVGKGPATRWLITPASIITTSRRSRPISPPSTPARTTSTT